MAEPRKAVAAKAAQTPARAAAGASPASSGGAGGANWLGAAFTVLVLFCVIGVIPTALGGEAFGYWRLPIGSFQLAYSPWSLTYDAPLAKPAPMLANATVRVATTPGGSTVVATLEPGFSTQVTRYATYAGARWAQITWGGPTRAAGGSGWTRASDLIAATTTSAASQVSQPRNIGDMGALSPAFGQAVGALGPGFASALYFPATSASYHTASIDSAEPLGSQVVPLVLTALYAKGIVAAQPNATSGPPAIARDLANGNAQALTFDYALVGDAQGIDTYLTQQHITGFQFAAHQPLQAQGSVRSLALFYSALASGALVSANDQAQIVTLLGAADNGAASAIAPQSIIGSGALIITTSNANGGVSTIAAGVLTPANGPTVVLVAVSHGASATATEKAMQTYFARLLTVLRG